MRLSKERLKKQVTTNAFKRGIYFDLNLFSSFKSYSKIKQYINNAEDS